MPGVLFKLLPTSKAINVPAANQQYLIYSATRKGCFYNEGCGFGLWGRMPGMFRPERLDNLDEVVRTIGQLSRGNQDHPPKRLYRTILSVDEETARTKHLYDRKKWEQLVNGHAQVIAEKFGIRQEDFCFLVSFHYKKTHPHIHLSFLDASDAPHATYIPKDRFERMMNEIRAEFDRALYKEEIHQLQATQKGQLQETREALETLLAEYPLPAMLNLDRITDATLDELGKGLLELAAHPPIRGSLRYQSLEVGYKAALNAWIDQVLLLPQFSAMRDRYEDCTRQISTLYGNGGRTADDYLEKARVDLYKALGNEVMEAVRTVVRNLDSEPPEDVQQLRTILGGAITQLLRADPAFHALVQAMPARATPWRELRKDTGFQALERRLLQRVVSDVRIRKRIQRYVDEKQDPERKAAIQLQLERMKTKDPAVRSDAKEKLKALRAEDSISKEAFSALYKTVGQIIYDETRADRGYPAQERYGLAMHALIQIFTAGRGQQARQQARRDQLKLRFKALSDTAKKDRRRQQSQAGGWEQEM